MNTGFHQNKEPPKTQTDLCMTQWGPWEEGMTHRDIKQRGSSFAPSFMVRKACIIL